MRMMWKIGVSAALCWMLTANPAIADQVTLGQQDFASGQFLSFNDYENAQIGEGPGEGDPSGIHGFMGNDTIEGSVLDVTMGFNLDLGGGPVELGIGGGPAQITSATITLGLFDHDSAQVGDQIATFTLNDDIDLTTPLRNVVEGEGGDQTLAGSEYNVYTINLPSISLDALETGIANFRLVLAAPSKIVAEGFDEEGPGNGAGLDFATLTFVIASLPEPSVFALLGLALAGFGIARRRP